MDFNRPRTIAIYARVSTDSEAQLHALDNQIEWYNNFLKDKPHWKVYKLYSDPGISGTSLKNRKAFLQMLEAAKKKKFDLVLTREIPRFSRNTMDALNYTRYLKSIGVEVYFAFEHLSSADDDEFTFTVLAAIAQKESCRISERVKAGLSIGRQKGIVSGDTPYGYIRTGNDTFIIDEKKARIVQEIFDLYLSGAGIRKISYMLESKGYVSPKGREHWSTGGIAYILRNIFYTGQIQICKYYTKDFLTHQVIKNRGDIELKLLKGNHQPIISSDIFEKTQKIMNEKTQQLGLSKNKKKHGLKTSKNVWQQKLICGKCGKKFVAAGGCVYNYRNEIPSEVYERRFLCISVENYGTPKARAKYNLEGVCDTPAVWTKDLKPIWRTILSILKIDKDEIKERVVKTVEKIVPKATTETSREKLEDEIKRLNIREEKLLDTFLDGIIDKKEFSRKKREIEEQKSILKKQRQSDNIEEESDVSQKKRIFDIIQVINNIFEKEFDEQILAELLIEKIVVYFDRFEWYIRCNSTMLENLKKNTTKKYTSKTDIINSQRFLSELSPPNFFVLQECAFVTRVTATQPV